MRIGITGCAGRMGKLLVKTVAEADDLRLVGAVVRPGHAAVGHDAGLIAGIDPVGVAVSDDPVPLFADADAVIDFTVPESTVDFAALAAQGKTALLIGTTGLSDDDKAALDKAARHTPILLAPNTALGPNLLMHLVRQAAARLDTGWDIEIFEMHHRMKVDAPSGTAVALGEAAAAGRGVTLADVATWSRAGHTGPRPEGEIGFATLRGGSVAGEHTVVFASQGERLELTHRATDRAIFAAGAVKAIRWLRAQPPGRYTMADMLGG